MGKGGGNDVAILGGILFILLFMGFFMPILDDVIGGGVIAGTPDMEAAASSIPNPDDGNTSTPFSDISSSGTIPTGLGIVESLARAFLWSYDWGTGYIAAFLLILHISIRIIGAVLIYRLIRSGAG